MDHSPGDSQGQTIGSIAIPFSKGSSQPRDWTRVSHIAGRFFTSRATKETQEYWSGYPIPSPEDLLNPGMELGSPALQVDSLPTELSGKPKLTERLYNPGKGYFLGPRKWQWGWKEGTGFEDVKGDKNQSTGPLGYGYPKFLKWLLSQKTTFLL